MLKFVFIRSVVSFILSQKWILSGNKRSPYWGAGWHRKGTRRMRTWGQEGAAPTFFGTNLEVLRVSRPLYSRVFQMWHFVKKKNCNASTIPSRAYINHIQKNFFPRTSLEGRPTWSKMVKIDQNRRGGGGSRITVPQIYVSHYATAA